MAVELMGFPIMEEQKKAIQEAASEGLKGMENLIRILSHQPSHLNTDITDVTVSKFKKLISLLNRTGHARFRRGPLPPAPPPPDPVTTSFPQPLSTFAPSHSQSLTLDFTKPNNVFASNNNNNATKPMELEFSKETFSVSSNSSFLSSAITGDGSVSNGKQSSSLFLTPPPPPPSSSGKPPLSSVKKRCHDHREHSDDISGKLSGSSSKCHCIKRRKNRVKKTVRVPAVSSKIADIPPDEYSWRKYGQKPIKGSPYPRGYYKCSTVRGCPARKHVERASDDPTMLIVTYGGEHRHSMQENISGAVSLVFESTSQ